MPQRSVTVKGVAGLGNRIITLAWAIRKSRQFNCQILVDWSDGQIGPKEFDLFSAYFTSQAVHQSIVSDWRIHSSSPDAKYNLLPSNRAVRFLARICRMNSDECWVKKHGDGHKYIFPLDLEILMRRNAVCAAHLPSIECQKEMGEIFFNQGTCEKFDAALPRDIGERIGIHIRHSDKKAKKSFKTVLEQYRDKKIFLATDSELVRDHALSLNIDMASLSSKLHDGKENGGVHHRVLDHEEKLQAFEESALDMYALCQCRLFVGQSNSSFSRVVRVWRGSFAPSMYWDK